MESYKAKDHGSLWVENPGRGGEYQEVHGGGNAQVRDEVRFPYVTGAGTFYTLTDHVRNAIRELVKEGEIETADGISHRLTDKGPRYPRF